MFFFPIFLYAYSASLSSDKLIFFVKFYQFQDSLLQLSVFFPPLFLIFCNDYFFFIFFLPNTFLTTLMSPLIFAPPFLLIFLCPINLRVGQFFPFLKSKKIMFFFFHTNHLFCHRYIFGSFLTYVLKVALYHKWISVFKYF